MLVEGESPAVRLGGRRPDASPLPVYLLAIAAVPIVVWEGWTLIAWLADGPRPVTAFRHGHTLDWYAARALEGVMVGAAIAVAVHVVQDCRRKGRILTFDVKFCLCAATLFWADLGANVFHPVFLASSNWVNLTGPCGHMPFVSNPDCGRAPDPILFLWLMETFGVLGFAILIGGLLGRVRRRRPEASTVALVGIVLACSVALVVLEPVVVALRLWTYPGRTPGSVSLGSGFSFPILPELLSFGLWFGVLAAVRIFKDDRGRSLVERGLDHHRPRVRAGLSLLALYGLMQMATWGIANAPLWPLGFHARPWPNLPASVVNGVCDAPGFSGTRYGPCPGSPGYRRPGRHSLPGRSP